MGLQDKRLTATEPPLPVFLTSEGSVSSTRMFGPVASGPKAQMERAASKSQSYLVWKNSPSFFLIEAEEKKF